MSSHDTNDTNHDTEDETETTDDREARKRGRVLARRHGLRDDVALALAYRELGYSHSGISSKIGVTEATVRSWMEDIAAEYGDQAVMTKFPEQRVGGLRNE